MAKLLAAASVAVAASSAGEGPQAGRREQISRDTRIIVLVVFIQFSSLLLVTRHAKIFTDEIHKAPESKNYSEIIRLYCPTSKNRR